MAEIYVMNADGSGQRNLTRNPAFDFAPVWSPDGRKIAFTSGRGVNAEVYVVNSDGSRKRRLTHDAALDLAFAWSPDGRKIAFIRWPLTRPPRKWGRDNEVYVVNADGTGLRNLTRSPGHDGDPVWSPVTGDRVARVKIDPLSPPAVAELAAPAGVDAEALYRQTLGNPFFVTEVVAAGEVEIPPTVRDAVLARAARLGSAARQVLDAVAVAPPHTELWLLDALAGGGRGPARRVPGVWDAHARAGGRGLPA